jgi:hypothetical protein
MDLELLKAIRNLDAFDSEEPIDWDEISNGRTQTQNRDRWVTLLKGLGGISPGMRFNPTKMAERLVVDIETKDERYVAWKPPTKGNAARTGMQSYIDIAEYYKKNYA